MTRSVTRFLRIPAILFAAVLVLAGCGIGGDLYNAPLPGGADTGSDPISISAEFDDVLDLVPQSDVKVDNVAVGRITSVELSHGGHSAHVEMLVRRDVKLPAGTTARLKQTSLLGEKYVALERPETPQDGPPVSDGSELGIAETSEAAQVEQVLGSLSLVLNGGDIGQFQEISRELQDISGDDPEKVKGFLNQMKTFVSGLDDRKEVITEALDNLAELSRTLDADKDKIADALDGLSPGMRVLADQREQLVSMLSALDKLSDVTVDTLNKAQEDIVADLKALQPILDQLAKAGKNLPKSLEILLTYPFPDSVLDAIKGDYFNVFIETNFRTPADCDEKGCEWPQPDNSPDYSTSGEASGGGSKMQKQDQPRTLLPPTDSAIPGGPQTVPSEAPDKDSQQPPSKVPGSEPGGESDASPSPSNNGSED